MQDTQTLDSETSPPNPAPAPTPNFSVPLTIQLEDAVVPFERLQGLQQGAVLPLGSSGGTIPVRILASGRPLATGTLVSIGDGYGVLIGGGQTGEE